MKNPYKRMWSESGVWEVMEGGVEWCGVDDKSKGRDGKGKGRVCTSNVSYGMGRHRGTWMERIQDSVGRC